MAQGDLIPSGKGKTKELRHYDDHDGYDARIEVTNLDDLTAGNGAKHDILPGKGELATTTICNVFQYLKERGVRVAYLEHGRTGPQTFLTWRCRMVKLEIVIRREAEGSYLRRHPDVMKGTRFERPIVEYHLKTSGKKWVGKDGVEHALRVDDPYLEPDFAHHGFIVFDPDEPVDPAKALFRVPFDEVGLRDSDLFDLIDLALKVFLALEPAWWFAARGKLKDLKIEAGWFGDPGRGDGRGMLYVADEISNDAWRLEIDGKEVSKELYRKGAPLDEVLAAYQLVARYTDKFKDMPQHS